MFSNDKQLRLPFCLPLFVCLVGCGSGGGSGNDGEDETNLGWITITSPTIQGLYQAELGQEAIELRGDVYQPPSILTGGQPAQSNCLFIDCLVQIIGSDSNTPNYSPSSTETPEVTVEIENETLGFRRTEYDQVGSWAAKIPLTLGDNHLVVSAFDSMGNRGEARIVVNVPEPDYVLPPHDITPAASPASRFTDKKIAASSNGDAVLAWTSEGKIFATIYHSGEWSASETLSELPVESSPLLAIDQYGRALVVWGSWT